MTANSTRGFQKDRRFADVAGDPGSGLERLCKPESDAILLSPSEEGVERIEARFQGNGFAPHRHDTYAIGLTLSGVQTFHYRGEQRASLPGQIIVIHPDELHDGGAGTETGLRYRMIYIAPERISEALTAGGQPRLPFVPAPVISDPRFRTDLIAALTDIDEELGDLKKDSLIADLASCLNRHADQVSASKAALNWPELRRCADYLKENCAEQIQMEQLENVVQLDRYSLSRQFRRAFGTSPHRYLVMRRLDLAKSELGRGAELADAAVASGFADQSHMTRHFKRAFGMTPGQWRHLRAASQSS